MKSNEYIKLNKQLNYLIETKAGIKIFNDFIEKCACNDNITDEEYIELLEKARNEFRIG